TQLRWNNRNDIEDHPLRLVAGLAESFDNLEALGVLEALLERSLVAHLLAQFKAQRLGLDALEQFLDRLCAHHGLEARRTVRLVEFAILGLFLDDLAIFDGSFAGFDDYIGFEVQHALEVAKRYVENMADTAGQALEEPDMRAGRGQLNVAE